MSLIPPPTVLTECGNMKECMNNMYLKTQGILNNTTTTNLSLNEGMKLSNSSTSSTFTQSSSGDLTITNTGNITIDPSNTLIIAGNVDMSGNNINNVGSIEIDNGTNNALLTIDGSGNLLIDPSLNLVVGTNSSLTLQPTNNLSTTAVPYGLNINSPSIKTYPTTTSFSSYPAYYSNVELGTNQTYNTTTGFNNVYGDYRNYTKSAGTTSDIERLNFTGFLQFFSWDDANTCKQYVSFSDTFNYNGKDANGRTSLTFNVNSISLTCPSSSTQTIANITARDALRISASNANPTYTITNTTAPNLLITGSGANSIVNITNHSFFSNNTNWNCNLTGAGSSATITNMFGLRLNPPSSSTGLTITNNWGVYSGWSLAKNYFAGGVGIGTTSISNALDLSGNAVISNNLTISGLIRQSNNYFTTSQSLSATTSKYTNTFNGTSSTATLPLVDINSVGVAFLITNVNVSSLTVASTSSQNIYSSSGVASATTRSLNQGHSYIFTAIQDSASTYGWSMV